MNVQLQHGAQPGQVVQTGSISAAIEVVHQLSNLEQTRTTSLSRHHKTSMQLGAAAIVQQSSTITTAHGDLEMWVHQTSMQLGAAAIIQQSSTITTFYSSWGARNV